MNIMHKFLLILLTALVYYIPDAVLSSTASTSDAPNILVPSAPDQTNENSVLGVSKTHQPKEYQPSQFILKSESLKNVFSGHIQGIDLFAVLKRLQEVSDVKFFMAPDITHTVTLKFEELAIEALLEKILKGLNVGKLWEVKNLKDGKRQDRLAAVHILQSGKSTPFMKSIENQDQQKVIDVKFQATNKSMTASSNNKDKGSMWIPGA